jgi:hypothetical protein
LCVFSEVSTGIVVAVPPGLELVLLTEEEVLDTLHRLRSGDVDVIHKEANSQDSADDESSEDASSTRKRKASKSARRGGTSKKIRSSPSSQASQASLASEELVRSPLRRAEAPVLTTERDTLSGLLGFVTTSDRQKTESYLQAADLSLRPVSVIYIFLLFCGAL